MLYQYPVLFILWSSLFSLTVQNIGCLRNEITILSTNTTLLPLTSIAALQADQPSYPVKDIVSRGPGKFWCTTGNGTNYVNMMFSQPVVVEAIFHVGATSTMFEHYVSSFSILYSSTENGPLQLYPTNFTAMSPGFVYKFTESITVLQLQFRINSYIANPFYCLQVDINGCTLDNVVQLCSITQSQEASPSPTNEILSNFVHPCTQQDPLPSYTPGSEQQQGSAADGILAGGAAVLVVGVVLLVSAIVLCATMPVIRKRMSGRIRAQRWTFRNYQPDSTSASKDHGTLPKTQYETGGIANTSDDSQDYASVMPYEQPMQTEANLCYTTIGQKHA